VAELKKGSYSAFDHLFAEYKDRLYAFAIGYLKVEDDAREIVQDVFVKVWEHRHHIDTCKSFNAYLFKISRNTILNYFRKKASEQTYLQYITEHTGFTVNSVEEEIEYTDLLEKADSVIEKLPSRQKEIFLMSRKEGLTNEEIAQSLNISKKTVENQITLAKQYLRKRLGESSLVVILFVCLL
jgi:RNA polymerase sigma-70 factor (ECF subfamily)